MKWLIYYIITLGLNLIGVIVFHEHLNLVFNSVIPLFMIGLSIFQVGYFSRHPHKKDFNTNNDSDLTEGEWERMTSYMIASYLIFIPLMIPFVWFFSAGVKLISILVFLLAFTGGMLWYRLRHRKEYGARFAKENKELEEQRKREELGKWK